MDEEKYLEVKRKLRNKINKFDLYDNLLDLYEAKLLINKILNEEKFPTKEYKERTKNISI